MKMVSLFLGQDGLGQLLSQGEDSARKYSEALVTIGSLEEEIKATTREKDKILLEVDSDTYLQALSALK
jgi:hypothetical protein